MPPPFRLTPLVFSTISCIDQSLGRLQGLAVAQPQPLLRKRNRVRSVQASAAIEGNALTVDRVTAVLEGRRVLASPKELREILNANAAYERLEKWQAESRKSLLSAHLVLMKGLAGDAGRFRTSGVRTGEHLAPAAHLVAHQVDELLGWLRRGEAPPLIAGCVVHYQLLFIHPFLDGNGRLARLWQQVVHREHSPLLQFVPVESVIRERQHEYYRALRQSDRGGDCTPFLEFSLGAVAEALTAFGTEVRPGRETAEVRLERAKAHFMRRWFSRRDYLHLHVKLSTATASRDLAAGVASRALQPRGTGPVMEYRFVRGGT